MMRRRVDGVDGVAHVRLADPEVVYRHLDRQPAAISVDQALLHLRSRSDLPPSAAAALDDLASAWTRGVSRFTLGPGDAEGLAEAVELVLALHRRASDATSILMDYRTFSRMVGCVAKPWSSAPLRSLRCSTASTPACRSPVSMWRTLWPRSASRACRNLCCSADRYA